MTTIDPTDTQFQESAVEKVRRYTSGGGWEVSHNGAWVIGVDAGECDVEPKVGETIRTYGRGIGSTVRGIVIGGRVYRYLTEAEESARHEQYCRDMEAKREQEFNEGREDADRRIEALPYIFRKRIYQFQANGGREFRRDYEGYELFCCEQAVAIAEALKTVEALDAWHKLPWGTQLTQVPALSDDHSGNTFGAACALARHYLRNPEFVAKMHGALTPLVGCDAYGCKH
jgi:hypothetical protein